MQIQPFQPKHYQQWKSLVVAYKAFYKTSLNDKEYCVAFERFIAGVEVFGIGAFENEQLIGLAHYFFHTTVWEQSVCYLQDLFVKPEFRGRGVGRKLIEEVARLSKTKGAQKYYWMTHESNPARCLYDRIASFEGFVRYDFLVHFEG